MNYKASAMPGLFVSHSHRREAVVRTSVRIETVRTTQSLLCFGCAHHRAAVRQRPNKLISSIKKRAVNARL